MAGGLPKKREQFHRLDGAKIAIIASMWHPHCVEGMVKRAAAELSLLGVKELEIHRVPGSLELPFAAQVLFEKRPELDAILAFGVVLKGATTHDDTVIQQVNDGFAHVTSHFKKPIINEVIGVSNIEDAELRSSDSEFNKGLEAVFAVSELLHWMKSL